MADTLRQINSPLAKLNSLGQLVCVLCNTPVKSAKVWTAHVNGREHRKNAMALKSQKQLGVNNMAPSINGNHAATQKRKPAEDTDEKTQPVTKKAKETNGEAATPVPSDFFDDAHPAVSVNKEEEDDASQATTSNTTTTTTTTTSANSTTSKSNQPPALPVPEGFFDDKLTDRRKRGVDERDPIEIELEKFQKEMKVVEQQNEVIEDEEDEAEEVQRTAEQIDAQIEQWKRVNELEILREQLDVKGGDEKEEPMEDEDDEDLGSDIEQLDTILDWRAKNV